MSYVERPVDPGGSPGRHGSDAVVDRLRAMEVGYVSHEPVGLAHPSMAVYNAVVHVRTAPR